MRKRKLIRILIFVVAFFLLLIATMIVFYHVISDVDPPEPNDFSALNYTADIIAENHYVCQHNRLRKNRFGLWEMYVEGNAFERGVVQGLLCKDLVYRQEKAFVDQLEKMIPAKNYQHFLKYFVGFFNRNLDTHVPEEYLLEIYGLSLFASEDFDYIGPNYLRILNYHAAHDIGHALQNMNLVACTAFGVWGEKADDSILVIGRNFDFYVGDAFNEEKIVAFIDPKNGHKFMTITWGGMIGVLSGMNAAGLTVSINAAKSAIPWGAKTPVSLVAREVLQHAATIDEAEAIIRARETFVSESFLIGSAIDGEAVVIEKTPEITSKYDPDTNYIVLTNHFQSNKLISDPLNIENLENETSEYRLNRVHELIRQTDVVDVETAADILRDRKGKQDRDIGLGNEKAINQLIAHHSVIFEPAKQLVWVSSNPYQLGAYLCYDLNDIFLLGDDRDSSAWFKPELSLPPDPFLFSDEYLAFQFYRATLEKINDDSKAEILTSGIIDQFVKSNPQSYLTYWSLGAYFEMHEEYEKALEYLKIALTKEIASKHERELITAAVNSCMENLK